MIIRDTVAPGDYILMAFTAGSFLHNKDEFKAFRRLRIMERVTSTLPVNASAGKTRNEKLAIPGNDLSLHFFPEGGHLVADQINCVAFKVTGQNGHPLDINGVLLEDGKPIDSIKTSCEGMGKVSFKPVREKNYTVRIAHSDMVYPLPPVDKEGIVLRLIHQNEETITFLATRTSAVVSNQIIISAQVRGILYALYKGEMKEDTLLFNLPKDKFAQGIVEITLYNEAMVPLVERLVYVNLNNKITIRAALSKTTYKKKDQVTLRIRASNEKGQPVTAHLGVSVYDGLYQNQQDFLHIDSYKNLYTQIRGEITNPDYFFDENNKNREQALDLLLLTQGWRKYVWGRHQLMEAMKGQQLISDCVAGNITSKKNLPNMLLAFSPDATRLVNPVYVSAAGAFQLSREQLLLAHHGYMYVKPLGSEELTNNAQFIFHEPFSIIDTELAARHIVYPVIAKKEKMDTLKILPNIPGLTTLQEVVVKAKGSGTIRRDKYMALLDSTARFSGNNDFVGQCGWLNCGSCGSGTRPVEGVTYTRYKDGRIPRHGSFSGDETVREPYRYPKYTEEELLKMYHVHRIQGYSDTKVFYSPDYELRPEEKSLPDFRNTLVWKPAVITDEKGEASITFFCSDIPGKFIGNIQGLDATGRMGYTQFNFMVHDAER